MLEYKNMGKRNTRRRNTRHRTNKHKNIYRGGGLTVDKWMEKVTHILTNLQENNPKLKISKLDISALANPENLAMWAGRVAHILGQLAHQNPDLGIEKNDTDQLLDIRFN
jgi:hypothetical protein